MVHATEDDRRFRVDAVTTATIDRKKVVEWRDCFEVEVPL